LIELNNKNKDINFGIYLLYFCKKEKIMNEAVDKFKELLDIMEDLRAKCPWDKAQTLESLRHLTIEETYELSDAILNKNMDEIKTELGDLLLHIVFYAKIGSETGHFDMSSVIDSINNKLKIRHPHIFGNIEVNNPEDVKKNWEKIKLKQGNNSVLGGVPNSLPALLKAYRIQEKVSGVGFDWENKEQVWNKIFEELNELKAEVDKNSDKAMIEAELGDLLFVIINYARFIGVNPEDALEKTNLKVIKRFSYIEKQAKLMGKNLYDMNLQEMDKLWEIAKTKEKKE